MNDSANPIFDEVVDQMESAAKTPDHVDPQFVEKHVFDQYSLEVNLVIEQLLECLGQQRNTQLRALEQAKHFLKSKKLTGVLKTRIHEVIVKAEHDENCLTDITNEVLKMLTDHYIVADKVEFENRNKLGVGSPTPKL